MTVGPPDHPETMHERITWDESAGVVTFRARNDPDKEGVVIHCVEQKEGVDVITFTFDWRFKEHVPQAKVSQQLSGSFGPPSFSLQFRSCFHSSLWSLSLMFPL
jgi:hypothetical protein